jgi:two-component system, sensor histidine kinase
MEQRSAVKLVMKGEDLPRWLRALAQPVTYLGVTMLIFLAIAVLYLVNQDRKNAYNNALRNGANLARVFEEYISSTIRNADATLLSLRKIYDQDPTHFDLNAWVANLAPSNPSTFHFGLVGPNGIVKASTSGRLSIGLDVRDREHFRVLERTEGDELYIGKPVSLIVSQRWAVFLARRLLTADGSFAGIIVASLDPQKLENFYRSVDLGKEGFVSLVGFDGFVRAIGTANKSHIEGFGRSVSEARVFQLYRQFPARSYWEEAGVWI